jgi:hypothetical protein
MKLTAVIVLTVAVFPSVVCAQAASPETTLQQELRHRRVIVRPVTPIDQVQQDVDQATAEVQRQQAGEGVVRDISRPPSRQPNVDPDLKGGIQTRSLNNALRR